MDTFILKKQLTSLCQEIALLSTQYPFKIITAESCTAGLISASLTDLPGSSNYVEGGYITYSNEMKQTALGVSSYTLQEFGAVSEQTAIQMVQGALNHSKAANCAIAVTGIAGPDGDSNTKPIGLVWIAVQFRNKKPLTQKNIFYGNREAIRLQTTIQTLLLIIKTVTNPNK